MRRDLSPNDQIVVERLLSQVVGRVGGALDTWTLVCLNHLVPSRHDFLTHHTEVLRALVTVVRAELAAFGRADGEPERRLLAELANACTDLGEAFSILERHEGVPAQEIRAATELLRRAYEATHASVRELARLLGIEVSYLKALTPDLDQYFQRLLNGLNDLFLQARSAGQAVRA